MKHQCFIGNADETPVFFDMPGDTATTVNECGASMVQVRKNKDAL